MSWKKTVPPPKFSAPPLPPPLKKDGATAGPELRVFLSRLTVTRNTVVILGLANRILLTFFFFFAVHLQCECV